MSLALTTAGVMAFVIAGFVITAALGWAILGVGCWTMEYVTREDSP